MHKLILSFSLQIINKLQLISLLKTTTIYSLNIFIQFFTIYHLIKLIQQSCIDIIEYYLDCKLNLH
jgi:hypothetical protein